MLVFSFTRLEQTRQTACSPPPPGHSPSPVLIDKVIKEKNGKEVCSFVFKAVYPRCNISEPCGGLRGGGAGNGLQRQSAGDEGLMCTHLWTR